MTELEIMQRAKMYMMSTDQPKIYCATRHFRQSVL